MGYNFVYLIIAIIALYVGFNIRGLISFTGLPSLGPWEPFLGLAFIFLAPVSMMKMVHAL